MCAHYVSTIQGSSVPQTHKHTHISTAERCIFAALSEISQIDTNTAAGLDFFFQCIPKKHCSSDISKRRFGFYLYCDKTTLYC